MFRWHEPVAVLRWQLSIRGQFQDGSEDISIHCQYLTVTFILPSYELLDALYDWSCMATLNRLPCYGALEIVVTLLLLLLLSSVFCLQRILPSGP